MAARPVVGERHTRHARTATRTTATTTRTAAWPWNRLKAEPVFRDSSRSSVPDHVDRTVESAG